MNLGRGGGARRRTHQHAEEVARIVRVRDQIEIDIGASLADALVDVAQRRKILDGEADRVEQRDLAGVGAALCRPGDDLPELLDRMIVAMGYARDDVYICNVVKCRPPENRKPEPNEMASCLPYLHEQLANVKPRAIVALGATAVQGLIGAAEGITRMRGNWKLYRGSIPVMPTFHPAYLLREPTKKADVWNDLQAVMKQLGKPLPKRGGG